MKKLKNLTKTSTTCLQNQRYSVRQSENLEIEIRLGINSADQKVKDEAKRRTVDAPPSTEEIIFSK